MGSVLLAMLLLVKDLNPNFITHLALFLIVDYFDFFALLFLSVILLFSSIGREGGGQLMV